MPITSFTCIYRPANAIRTSNVFYAVLPVLKKNHDILQTQISYLDSGYFTYSTTNNVHNRSLTRSSLDREIWHSNLGRSNRTQCCQWLTAAATFLRKKLCCPGAITRRLALPTRYRLQGNTASIMKDLMWLIDSLLQIYTKNNYFYCSLLFFCFF